MKTSTSIMVTCPHCRGKRRRVKEPFCLACGGSGKVLRSMICETCRGAGIFAGRVCAVCGGWGVKRHATASQGQRQNQPIYPPPLGSDWDRDGIPNSIDSAPIDPFHKRVSEPGNGSFEPGSNFLIQASPESSVKH